MFGYVTAYVNFNLFELLASQLKMKLAFSDEQVKVVEKFNQNVCVGVYVYVCTFILKENLVFRMDN